jgi:predicted 3-demethylubiquinone-9 3-methyltransferase (glyoxalase superfamily)
MVEQQKIAPCLWFDGKAQEAAEFYISLFPNSQINRILRWPMESTWAKKGDPLLVEFTLDGHRFQALNGGPNHPFNDAISLSVACSDQTEVDRLWNSLTANGGKPVQCSWLKDKYGVSWQIVPEALPRMLNDQDTEKAKRVMDAMMQMVKIDAPALQAVYDNAQSSCA